MKLKPSLDKNFQPAIIELTQYSQAVESTKKMTSLSIYIERNNGYNYIYNMNVFIDGYNDLENYRIVERVVKGLLWMVGGYRIIISGSIYIYERLKADYTLSGRRKFDTIFMAKVFEQPFSVEYMEVLPKIKTENKVFEPKLDGCRIGFDAGGSDRKVSAVIDGNVLFSEEIIWHPKQNFDPKYHFQGILDSLQKAASYLPRVDAIGISSAGIYVDNKIMAASLFLVVNDDDFEKTVKTMYIDVVKNFGDVSLVVANDGDVTALAGAIDLNQGNVLGIAMGTSEAGGYVDKNKQLLGWLNELAFVPIDFNQDSIVDEWSQDFGVGCKYFSQDAVIKLAGLANIEIDSDLSLAEKLKFIQHLNEAGNPDANLIFQDIGIYLGYTLAYHLFYAMKHVLVLGRVVSGKGGNTIIEYANKVLNAEFNYLDIQLTMPDETSRRVGQSIAAASMPEIRKRS